MPTLGSIGARHEAVRLLAYLPVEFRYKQRVNRSGHRSRGGGVLPKRSCIFCDASGPLTNEHVIPDWLQRYVGGSEKSTVRGAHLSAIGTLLSERRASGNSHKLGTVCEACNNGWMSDLESSFSSLLPRLEADMSPRQFSTAERRTIALWIVKTGIIVHYSSNYRIILPASVPRTLSQGMTVPAGIKVFGGSVPSEKTIRWSQSNVGVAVVRSSDVPGYEPRQNTFVFALSIRNIFIGFGWHGLNQDEFEMVCSGDPFNASIHTPNPRKICACLRI
jgi:hypothetical protein